MDGTPFIKKLKDVLKQDATLMSLLGTTSVVDSEFSPVNNVYPQICVKITDGESQPIFPAGEKDINITIWVDKNSVEPFTTLHRVADRIKFMLDINRNSSASNFNSINLTTNTGLRVCSIVKKHSDHGFDSEIGKYFYMLLFSSVVSENEDFSS